MLSRRQIGVLLRTEIKIERFSSQLKKRVKHISLQQAVVESVPVLACVLFIACCVVLSMTSTDVVSNTIQLDPDDIYFELTTNHRSINETHIQDHPDSEKVHHRLLSDVEEAWFVSFWLTLSFDIVFLFIVCLVYQFML